MSGRLRIGIACPYTWDVPGGVQAHVHDLADSLIALGHDVSVLSPVDDPDEADLPPYVVPAGRAVPVPYNGSVARLVFGPLSLARTRRWLREGSFDVLTERLEDGRTLCLLADRDLSARGIDVTFFGATARMPAGPATLALRTHAHLIPVTLSFRDHGWQVVFHPEVEHSDVATMTQSLADAFAGGIAQHPQDWHMLQRLWLDDLEPGRSR